MQIISSCSYHFFLAFFLEVNFDAIFISGLTLVTAQQVVLPKTFAFSKLFFLDFPENSQAMFSQLLSFFSASLDAFLGRKFDEDKINMHINEKLTENAFEWVNILNKIQEQLKILGSKVDPPRVKKDQHFLFKVWTFEPES
jgi:hypothetical protein